LTKKKKWELVLALVKKLALTKHKWGGKVGGGVKPKRPFGGEVQQALGEVQRQ